MVDVVRGEKDKQSALHYDIPLHTKTEITGFFYGVCAGPMLCH